MDFAVVISNNNSFLRKNSVFCFEPVHEILKYKLQEYYNVPDENFLVTHIGSGMPVLSISQDCFDIPKKILDNILAETHSVKVYDREQKDIIAVLYKNGNPEDNKNIKADYTPVQNFKELREKHQAVQKEIIERHENNGVQFVSLDGVGISPFAEIKPGAVIWQGTIIKGKSSIGADSVLGPNTVAANSIIGDNCVINSTQVYSSVIENGVQIGPFCHIRPNCVIKNGAKIGDFVEIKNSTVGENTHASHLTYIGDSDVGKNVNFGCGTVTVNYDGIKKARCIIGDGAFIGCNTNLIAPVTIGEDGYTAAGSTITRDVPADSLAVS